MLIKAVALSPILKIKQKSCQIFQGWRFLVIAQWFVLLVRWNLYWLNI